MMAPCARLGSNASASPTGLVGVSVMTVTVAVFDIDGVVADVRHRLHLIEGRRRDWVRFHESAVYDPALVEGITLVNDLGGQHEVAWLSGRPEWLRAVTRDWLAKHDLPHTAIHLRGDS